MFWVEGLDVLYCILVLTTWTILEILEYLGRQRVYIYAVLSDLDEWNMPVDTNSVHEYKKAIIYPTKFIYVLKTEVWWMNRLYVEN